MKLYYKTFIFCLASIFLFGCKQDTKKVDDASQTPSEMASDSDKSTAIDKIHNMKDLSVESVQKMNAGATTILNHRWKETDKKAYIFLDKDLWEYEFIYSGRKMSAPGELQGYWVDFNEDLTYTYGHYDKELGKGKYHFSDVNNLLLMVDDSNDIKPKEFEAKIYNNTLILDGNETYRDNNFNGKLRRLAQRPVEGQEPVLSN